MSFTAQDLKSVPLEALREAAGLNYGSKNCAAGRIALVKGGKRILSKLIKMYAKKKQTKAKQMLQSKGKGGTKADFFKKERARLIGAGATDKKKIEAECKRLWGQSTLKCNGGICKKSAKDTETQIVTSTNMLTPAEAKARNLVLIGADASDGKTVFKYKVTSSSDMKKVTSSAAKKATLKTKAAREDHESDDDESDDDLDMGEVEERVIARLKGKNVDKREYLDGMNSAYGVDTKGWTLAHAKEELVIQMLNQTDDEASDDEPGSDEEDDD